MRTPGFWVVVAIVISIASAVSLPYLRFDYNLLHLQNQQAPAVKALYEVMDASKNDTGDQVSTIYAVRGGGQRRRGARALRTKLMALPEVARVDSPLDLIPTDQDEKMPIIRRIVAAAHELNVKPATPKREGEYSQGADRHPQACWAPRRRLEAGQGLRRHFLHREGRGEGLRLDDSGAGAGGQGAPLRVRAGAGEALQRLPRTAPSPTCRKTWRCCKTQKDDRGLTLDDLPPQLKKLYVSKDGKILLQVYGKQDLWERAPDNDFTKAVLEGCPAGDGHADPQRHLHRVPAHQLSARRRLGVPRHRGADLPPLPELSSTCC